MHETMQPQPTNIIIYTCQPLANGHWSIFSMQIIKLRKSTRSVHVYIMYVTSCSVHVPMQAFCSICRFLIMHGTHYIQMYNDLYQYAVFTTQENTSARATSSVTLLHHPCTPRITRNMPLHQFAHTFNSIKTYTTGLSLRKGSGVQEDQPT